MRGISFIFVRNIILFFSVIMSFDLFSQNVIWDLTGDVTDPIKVNNWEFNYNDQGTLTNTPVLVNHDGNSLTTEIGLTKVKKNQSASIYYKEPINLLSCDKWNVEFDYRAWGGNAADGVAFAFFKNRPTGFESGANIGLPSNDNYGFLLVFDTHPNISSSGIWPSYKPGNENRVPLLHFQEITPNEEYKEIRTDNVKTYITGASGTIGVSIPFVVHGISRHSDYRNIRLTYDKGVIDIYIYGRHVHTHVLKHTYDYPGYLLFSASTGGKTDGHSIRNARIILEKQVVTEEDRDTYLCSGNSMELDAGDGYDYYEWRDAGGNILGYTQKITINSVGSYTSFKRSNCQEITQVVNVKSFGNIENPLIDQVDTVYYDPILGEEVLDIYLCGSGDYRILTVNIEEATRVTWKRNGVQVFDGKSFIVMYPGNYELYIEIASPDGSICFKTYKFNVYKSNLSPEYYVINPDCSNGYKGKIIITNVGDISNNQYSIDGINYQDSNEFEVDNVSKNYTVYIKEKMGGCVYKIENIYVDEYEPISLSVTKVNDVTCNGYKDGKVILNVIGGSPPYKYYSLPEGGTIGSTAPFVIKSSDTHTLILDAGTYRYYVEDREGCTTEIEQIEITEPDEIKFNVETVNESCRGGGDGKIIISNVTGGAPPYQYSINGGGSYTTDSIFEGETGTVGGKPYKIQVKDANGCIVYKNIKLYEVKELEVDINSSPPSCNGGNDGFIEILILNANVNNYKYSIDGGNSFHESNIFYGLIAGSYSVVVRPKSLNTNICDENYTVLLENDPIYISVDVIQELTCSQPGKSQITFIGGTPPYKYSRDGGITYQDDNVFVFLGDVVYEIKVMDAKGCIYNYGYYRVDNVTEILSAESEVGPMSSCEGIISEVTIKNVFTQGSSTVPVVADSVRMYRIPVLDENKPDAVVYPTTDVAVFQNITLNIDNEPIMFIVYEEGCTYTLIDTLTGTKSRTIIEKVNDVSCRGGEDGSFIVKVDPSATYSKIEYRWENLTTLTNSGGWIVLPPDKIISNLKAGLYNIQLRFDENDVCILTFSGKGIMLLQPPDSLKLYLKELHDTPHCIDGGKIVLEAQGGWGKWKYKLEDDKGNVIGYRPVGIFTGLSDGIYTGYVIDSVGCEVILNDILINRLPKFTLSYEKKDVRCYGANDGEIKVISNSINPPVEYKIVGGGISTGYIQDTNTVDISHVFDSLRAGEYQIYVRDINGCEDSLLIDISEPSELVFDSIVVEEPICFDDKYSVTLYVKGGNGRYEYRVQSDGIYGAWSSGNVFTGLQGDTNVYVFEVRDSLGCTSVSDEYIFINPLPISTEIKLLSGISCKGDSTASISVEIYGGIAPYQTRLLDEFDNPIGGYSSTNFYTNLSSGNYKIEVRDSRGCEVISEVIRIVEPEMLSIDNIIVSDVKCSGENTGKVEIQVSGGVPPYEYNLNNDVKWESDNILENLVSGDYILIVRDSAGCVIDTTFKIEEPDSLYFDYKVKHISCKGSHDGQIFLSIEGGEMPYKVIFRGDTIKNVNSNTFTISDLAPIGFGVLEVVDANGCSYKKSGVKILEPSEEMTSDIILIPMTCKDANDAKIIVDSVKGGWGNYEYMLIQLPSTMISNWSTTNIFNNLSGGSYELHIRSTKKEENSKNRETDKLDVVCEIDTIIIVDNHEEIVIEATLEKNVECYGDKAELRVKINGGIAPYKVSFDNINYEKMIGNESIYYLDPGSYLIYVEDSVGCKVIYTDTINTNKPIPIVIDLEIEETLCFKETLQVKVIASGGTGSGYVYSLDDENYTNDSIYNLAVGNSYRIYVKDGGNCVSNRDFSLDVVDSLYITSIENSYDCKTNISTHNVFVKGGTPEYMYTFKNNSTGVEIEQSNRDFTNLDYGIYTVYVRDKNGCITYYLNYEVKEILPLKLRVWSDAPGSIKLEAVGGVEPYEYSLNKGEYLDVDHYFVTKESMYLVTVKDANGCEDSAKLYVESPFLIPNFFTPNQDGVNDNFQIIFYGSGDLSAAEREELFRKEFENATITIYNRQGMVIKKYKGREKGWDGTLNGKVLSSEDFWFTIEFEDGQVATGSLRLNR